MIRLGNRVQVYTCCIIFWINNWSVLDCSIEQFLLRCALSNTYTVGSRLRMKVQRWHWKLSPKIWVLRPDFRCLWPEGLQLILIEANWPACLYLIVKNVLAILLFCVQRLLQPLICILKAVTLDLIWNPNNLSRLNVLISSHLTLIVKKVILCLLYYEICWCITRRYLSYIRVSIFRSILG